MNAITENDIRFMKLAYAEALQSYEEGGVPVGSVMVQNGELIARGHNRRVQHGDPTSHGETDCLRQGGLRDNYLDVDLYTTLSPCMMCTGAVVYFDIKRVVIGENRNFPGNIEFLAERGIEVVLMEDQDCLNLMAKFIQERPDIWFEDIAGKEQV